MYNEVVIANRGIIMILGWHCNRDYDDILMTIKKANGDYDDT